jgi:hypothetical protein
MSGKNPDASAKRRKIDEAREAGTCPNCGGPLGPDPVGSGRLSEGRFCGLDCQGAFYEDYYRERIRASRPSSN